jgi:cold shock protein
MPQGTIERLTDKGFGFIKRADGEKDLFFHMNDLVDVAYDDLELDQVVTFEIKDGDKGPSAIKVAVMERTRHYPTWVVF